MRLKELDMAVDFEAFDYLNNKIRLSDYKGQKVMLSFFRGASCPFCNLRVQQLINNYSEFEKNEITLITFFAASNEEIIKYAGKQNASFPILDKELNYYKKYGVEQSSSGMIKTMANPIRMAKMMVSGFFNLKSIKEKPIVPADFLIDENQRIYKVHYGGHYSDHLDLKEVLNWQKENK